MTRSFRIFRNPANLVSMYYHSTVLLLFRPFLRVDLTNSKVSPQEICSSSADNVAALVAKYRRIYGLRRTPILVAHAILTSSIIHLLHLPKSLAVRYLAQSITGLREISANHAYCFRALRIIIKLADQWNIQLPDEVEKAANDIPHEGSTDLTNNANAQMSYLSPISNPFSIRDPSTGKFFANDMYSTSKNMPKPYTPLEDMYWSPFADGSVPLPTHVPGDPIHRPMEIANMLNVPNNQWDQWNQDGFRFPAHGEWNYDTAPFSANVEWPQRG